MKKEILFKNIDRKAIVWFENSNQYLILEKVVAQIIKELYLATPLNNIAESLSKELDVPLEKAVDFILDIEKNILIPNQEEKSTQHQEYKDEKTPLEYEFTKYYRVNNITLRIDFSSEFELSLVHPKFAYLEVPDSKSVDFHYQVFTNNGYTFLYVNATFIGSWSYQEIHYFQGKHSMQVVQQMHHKPEEDWLGVFHASAVSDGTNGMLFLGDSGNGKSTSLALLQANGFHCIADDFVPVSALDQVIYSFPAAISIKKNSLKVLLPYYPELKTTAEYHFTRLNKTVRFLPPKNENAIESVPCKGLIFIKYDKNIEFELTKISNVKAFEKLIPDSWLSPISKNVDSFLEWFVDIPCYEITYSDNDRMISEVSKLFKNVL